MVWQQTDSTMEQDFQSFRDYYYQHMCITASATTPPSRILILEKRHGGHMSNIENRLELLGVLRAKFPQYNTSIISWSGMTLREQLELLIDTKMMISLPGAAVLNGIFMPNGSSLVLFCRLVDHRNIDGLTLTIGDDVHLWFRHLNYVITVAPSDEQCNASTMVRYNETTLNTRVVDLEAFGQAISNALNK